MSRDFTYNQRLCHYSSITIILSLFNYSTIISYLEEFCGGKLTALRDMMLMMLLPIDEFTKQYPLNGIDSLKKKKMILYIQKILEYWKRYY